MKINLQINNTTKSPVLDEFLQKVAEETFAVINADVFDGKEVVISLALVDPERIRELNQQYRQHDETTDILSFPEHSSLEGIRATVATEQGAELFLGELILCYDDIKEYAAKENLKLEVELANVVSHGILHLLGYKHGEEMFALQAAVKNKF